MTTKVLLTTTSYQDTPGTHHELLNSQGWQVETARGPLNEAQMLEMVGDFDGFICGDDQITARVIDKALPRLKWISKYGIGLDKIDKQYATSKEIPIGFCPGVNHTTVAEHTFGLLISLTKKIAEVSRETASGRWTRVTGTEIYGKTIGVVGLGRIGKEIVKRANAFGMKVLGYDVFWDEQFASLNQVQRREDLHELLAQADIVSLNCSLNEETNDLINRKSIAKMKPGVLILNCARGEVVNSADMVEALESGQVGGYGADVLDVEPPPPDHPLMSAPNTVITSHIGSRTFESVQRQAVMATQNAIHFAAGQAPLAQANKIGAQSDPAQPKKSDSVCFVVPNSQHNELVTAAFLHRGYSESEAGEATQISELASIHGIRTHNAIKALHLDHLFGSGTGGCVPSAEVAKIESRFKASEIWDAQRKLGQSVAMQAMQRAMKLADEYGIGQVSVDNAFHYLWGGGYVMDAASKGYIAYTNCTSTLAEVVPFMGKRPTLGTNPHSWGFPTTDAIGFPIVIDWATSTVAMGRVQQLKREGKPLPPNAAVDADGNPTTDPNAAVSLLPFGAHKGYGLCLINELMGALIGSSLPTLRGREVQDGEKSSAAFYFQVIHPDALGSGLFAKGREQKENLKVVLDDILSGPNSNCLWPGQIEAEAAALTNAANGLLFSAAEINSFNEIASECGHTEWDLESLQQFDTNTKKRVS